MRAVIKRELRNYLKRPLFWVGIFVVIYGVFQATSPYLGTHYLAQGEEITNDYPEGVRSGEVYEGYVPSDGQQRREIWNEKMKDALMTEFQMTGAEAKAVIDSMKEMDIWEACTFLEEEYGFYGAYYAYEDSAYHKGSREEINSYLEEKMEHHTFSFYYARKFADFAGLYMGFFASIMLSVLFLQDTRRNTYELLHTKPIPVWKYILGKAGGGFLVCLFTLAILNLVFWTLALVYTRDSGFVVRLWDFLCATALYILPNMLMIVCVYMLISLLFKNPLPGLPFLILYTVYSNMGGENAEGVYGYYGRPLAIMVRFPGQLFDTSPPPMALLNQIFLILASAVILLVSMQLWKRRRM